MTSVAELEWGGARIRISGNPGDSYFSNISHHMLNNDFLAPLLAYHVEEGATILDIGANVGLTTMLAHTLVKGARIISVEPSSAFPHLQETLRLNGAKHHSAIKCCVGNYDGTVSFASPVENTSAGHMVNPGVPGEVAVKKVDTLVKEIKLNRLDFVKIDVEGHELDVLDGMKMTIRKFQPLILMEFNAFALTAYGNISPRKLLDHIVNQFGAFIVHTKGHLRLVSSETERDAFLHANMLEHSCVDDIAFTPSAARLARFQL